MAASYRNDGGIWRININNVWLINEGNGGYSLSWQ
jgi:hypothetical protein